MAFLHGSAGPSDATIYAPLRDSVAARGHTSIDLVEALRAQTITSDPLLADGHNSPDGNALVARWLARELGTALEAACAVGPGPACARIRAWRSAL